MKIKKRIPNKFEIITKLNGDEDDVSSKEELCSLDWIKEFKEVFYKTSDGFDYLVIVDSLRDVYFGTVIGYIFGSGKDIGLEECEHHIGMLKLRDKLKNE